MMQYAVLGSGSSGNSYVFSDGTTSILVDQGYSLVELKRRLSLFGIDSDTLKAVFVTHLHPDHAKGVGLVCRRLGLSAYISTAAATAEREVFSRLGIPDEKLRLVEPFERISVGSFELFCFPTSHDSIGSVGWFLCTPEGNLMVLTDTGLTTSEHIRLAKEAKILFLEANYDSKMLETGPYPYYLKRRINGKQGHLSNEQDLSFLKESGFSGNHVYLIHLSDVNNDPVLLENFVKERIEVPFTVCRKNQWYGSVEEAL